MKVDVSGPLATPPESKAIAVLSHPNIVKVFDVSFGDLIQYIVMEYIEGQTLKQLLKKCVISGCYQVRWYMLEVMKLKIF